LNSIVKDYYEQTWHAHADPEHFRKQFIKECNREWDIKIQCDYVENSIQYITGANSNAIGSLISTEKLKPGDDKKIEYNLSKLKNLEHVIEKEKQSIQDNETLIHDSSGRILLKDYFIVQHNFNVKMTSKLCSSKESVLKTLEQCNKLKAKYNDILVKRFELEGQLQVQFKKINLTREKH